jgi:hypothetical protein
MIERRGSNACRKCRFISVRCSRPMVRPHVVFQEPALRVPRMSVAGTTTTRAPGPYSSGHPVGAGNPMRMVARRVCPGRVARRVAQLRRLEGSCKILLSPCERKARDSTPLDGVNRKSPTPRPGRGRRTDIESWTQLPNLHCDLPDACPTPPKTGSGSTRCQNPHRAAHFTSERPGPDRCGRCFL